MDTVAFGGRSVSGWMHASAFEDIRSIIDHCPYGRYYPPYDEQDTACLQGVSVEDRRRLDSLLAEIGSERIFM